jgi:hypothetical protein
MAERPDLTYEVFITMAKQQGFEMDMPHLEELFPEVKTMVQRMKLLDHVDTVGIQPGSNSIPTDTVAMG